MSKNWKEKHEVIIKNKRDIIKQYKDYVPVKLIAREYGLSTSCISNNMRLWGIKRSGIKYLLGKCLRDDIY